MPTYEYICDACGREYEKFQSITAKPDRVCPSCKARKVRRKIGIGSAVIFKGSGFYETDYRGDGYAKAAEAERKSSETPKDTATSAADAPKSGAADAAKPAPAAKPAVGGKSPTTGKNSGVGTAATEKSTTSNANNSDKSPRTSSSTNASPASKAVHPARVGRGQGNLRRKPGKK